MADYTPTAQWATNRPVLDDGDPPDAATWLQSLEDIYDRLEYHHDLNHVEAGLVKWLRTTSPTEHNGVGGAQVFAAKTTPPIMQLVALTYPSYLHFDIDDLPDGCKLQSLRIYLKGGPSHGALPTGMPQIVLQRIDPAGGAITTMGTATDGAANVAAYEALHSFALGFSSPGLTLDKTTYTYRLQMRSEYDTNSQPLLEIWGVKAIFDMTHLDKKAG